MASRQKAKFGSTAIPFLLTILISLIIFGTAALYILNELEKEDVDISQSIIKKEYYVPEEESNHTLMMILDLEDGVTTDTFMVIRVLPASKKYVCIPINSNTLINLGDGDKRLAVHYAEGGIIQTKKALENLLGVDIDRYMKMNSESFQKICNILGNVNYNVPDGIEGMTQGLQYLVPTQIQYLINYNKYENGEKERTLMTGTLITNLLNQVNGDRVANSLDEHFNTIINMVDSDITAIDYSDHSKAIKYLLTESTQPAKLLSLSGTTDENKYFIMDKSVKENIRVEFEINN